MEKVRIRGMGMTIELISVVRKVVSFSCFFINMRMFFSTYGKVNNDNATSFGNVPKTSDKMIAK